MREICAAVGLQSTATVHYHLNALRESGLIQMDDMKKRTITLPDAHRPDRIPVIGVVTAGIPILPWRTLRLHPVGRQRLLALRVRGDSMIGAGILDGDKGRHPSAARGKREIVVALLEDSATVKRLKRRARRSGSCRKIPRMTRSTDGRRPFSERSRPSSGNTERVSRETTELILPPDVSCETSGSFLVAIAGYTHYNKFQ